MIRTPPASQSRRRMRLVALGVVFVLGAFFAQGEAADAQQMRYSTVASSSVEVPPPLGATPVAARAVSAAHGADRVVPFFAVVPTSPSSTPSRLLEPWCARATDGRPQHARRLASDRAPPPALR